MVALLCHHLLTHTLILQSAEVSLGMSALPFQIHLHNLVHVLQSQGLVQLSDKGAHELPGLLHHLLTQAFRLQSFRDPLGLPCLLHRSLTQAL